MPRPATPSDPLPPYQRIFTPNILIVGETGVGKSSVINLIAGEELADVSSSANGCTLDAASYDIVLRNIQGSGHHVRLFDTVGLNEPSMSKNDYLTAIVKAKALITELQRTGGIRLLIFCIRGGRITEATQHNYRLFRYALCQDQVPVAFVITGLESEHPMEGWWKRNAASFNKARLSCNSHVCVTATRGLEGVYDDQYEESQVAVRKMLMGYMSEKSWKLERTHWFVSLAGMLLKWVEKITRSRKWNSMANLVSVPSSRDLNIESLIHCLERECNFSHEEAVELAGRIWEKRTESTTSPEGVKEVGDGDSFFDKQ